MWRLVNGGWPLPPRVVWHFLDLLSFEAQYRNPTRNKFNLWKGVKSWAEQIFVWFHSGQRSGQSGLLLNSVKNVTWHFGKHPLPPRVSRIIWMIPNALRFQVYSLHKMVGEIDIWFPILNQEIEKYHMTLSVIQSYAKMSKWKVL